MRRLIVFLGTLLLASNAMAADLQVGAAASLTDALRDIGRLFERDRGIRVRFNFAGSSTLALQIREGAPIDVFVSADERQMDSVALHDDIVPRTRRQILSNALVIVVPRDRRVPIRNARDLTSLKVGNIAIAEPTLVPAGVYAKQYLQAIGVWSRIQRKIVPTDNVRATLAAVESGNVDAGIVYATDAAISHRVRIAAVISGPTAPHISYSAAVIRGSSSAMAAAQFVGYLTSPEARQVFARYGFIVR